MLVGRSFGLFGIVVPIIVTMMGARILRRRPVLFHHSVLSSLLVLILGSLTLGVAFDDGWGMFNSGWGGACGIEMGRLLSGSIGMVGCFIVLLGGWILTGVFINRNFINTVNRAGNVLVDKSGKLVGTVAQKVPSLQSLVVSRPREEEDDEQAAPAESGVREVRADPSASARRGGGAAAGAGRQPCCRWGAGRGRGRRRGGRSFRRAPCGRGSRFGRRADRQRLLCPQPRQRTTIPSRSIRSARKNRRVRTQRRCRRGWRARRTNSSRSTFRTARTIRAVRCRPILRQGRRMPMRRRILSWTTDEPFTVKDAGAPAAAGDAPEGVVVTVEEHHDALLDEHRITTEAYDPLKDLVNYRRPSVALLEDYLSDSEVTDEEIYENKSRIEETLKNFGIPIQRIKATTGPTVTLYEIVQAQGVKISRIQNLQNDIAQSLKALGIRIIAPIPGKGTIGIEVPNRNKQIVSMYSAVRSMKFQEAKAELPVVIGRTIQNENYVFDLAKMPHLLVAGATGQGKSVGPERHYHLAALQEASGAVEVRDDRPQNGRVFALCQDRTAFPCQNGVGGGRPSSPIRARRSYTLNSLCIEMENRLSLCKDAGARNIKEYNEKFTARRLNPLKGHRYLPYIVVVVDEFADLIMTAKEVEGPVMRLAQKARAVGIHLIIATQRPDVKVITGGIKANFPARIAFRVMQMIDSRTIIDRPGAEQLIGRGDMLFSNNGELTRIQCALVDTPEVERIVEYISKQQSYTSAYNLPDYTPESGGGEAALGSESSAPVKYDSKFAEIARDAVSQGQISTSMIQRNYEVGFNRAGRIMMQLERAGIVGRQEGAKPRDILYHDLPSLEAKLQELGVF